MNRGMHAGDLTLAEDGRFRGMVTGTLTIATGCTVDMAGMVTGSLVVEPGASVLMSGMVNGGIVDLGGQIAVTGMVTG